MINSGNFVWSLVSHCIKKYSNDPNDEIKTKIYTCSPVSDVGVEKYKFFKGGLRPKLHHCFYGISLLISCRKRLDQFSQSYEITKFWIQGKCPHTPETFHTWFSSHIFLHLRKKNLQRNLMVFFIILHKIIKLNDHTAPRRKWRHPGEWTYIIC